MQTAVDYKQALETAVQSVVIISKEGIILSANQSTCKLFGYTKIELLGKNIKILTPNKIAKHHDSYLSNYMQSRKPSIIGLGREVNAVHKNGDPLKIFLSVSEMQQGEGDSNFMGIIQDLTSKHYLESRFEVALEALKFGVWEMDIRTNTLSWDKGM